MATKSLADLQNAFKTPDRESTGSGLPNNYYPFWNMKEGESAIVRFLPDGNAENPLGFLVEKVMHNLDINGERKSVPCLSMYGEDCPICALSSKYYKAEDKTNGKKYWKKKQHVAQALIVEDPMDADETTGENHEGKVRYVALGFQVFAIIKAAFEDGELDEIPYAYEGGTNFIIKKTKQGEYASYSLSKFARKSTDLEEDVIANFDLADLSDLLPRNPGIEKVEAMLEAAVTGSEYSNDSSAAPTPSKAKETSTTETSTTVESKDDAAEDESDDILAEIRARRAAKTA